MSCLEFIDSKSAGSDIDFALRFDNADDPVTYSDISDITAIFRGVIDGKELFTCSIDSNSTNGSSVSLETDTTSQYLACHIESTETIGMTGKLEVYTITDSANYGNQTCGKGYYELTEVK